MDVPVWVSIIMAQNLGAPAAIPDNLAHAIQFIICLRDRVIVPKRVFLVLSPFTTDTFHIHNSSPLQALLPVLVDLPSDPQNLSPITLLLSFQ